MRYPVYSSGDKSKKLREPIAKSDLRVGIIGIGSMGRGLLYQSQITPGIKCVAVCDTNIQRCINALTWLGLPYQVVNSPLEADATIERNIVAVSDEAMCIAESQAVQAVIEASNAIGSAAKHSVATLENHKHLILMNSEIDLTFGPALSRIAEGSGVICTSADGDQYGVLKHLIDDIRLWGFELVMAGNIKGFLDTYANPTTIIPAADKRKLDYRMCASYTDGTKLNIEMAIIANACGLTTKTPGMYGPTAVHVEDIFRSFDFDALWEDREPFVDYILGAEPGGGVFVVGHCDNPYQREMLTYYKMGEGPYYLFYRPYHLCHIETLATIIRTISEGKGFLNPDYGFQTNVFSYAKRQLNQGERLDGGGGFTCYGRIENFKENISNPGLPICLAENVMLNRSIAKDQPIRMGNVSYDSSRLDFKLYTQGLKQ
jgi:predicted homoserine dehydrogenase-like protein